MSNYWPQWQLITDSITCIIRNIVHSYLKRKIKQRLKLNYSCGTFAGHAYEANAKDSQNRP